MSWNWNNTLQSVHGQYGRGIANDVPPEVQHSRGSASSRSPWTAGAVTAALAEDYGIGVRDGRFCAHLLVDRFAGTGGAAVRATLGLGTTDEHVGRLLSALATLSGNVRTGPVAPRPSRISDETRPPSVCSQVLESATL